MLRYSPNLTHTVKHLLFSALTLFLFAVSVASAQTSKGTIAGSVTDSTGAAIAGATVSAKDTQGGEVRTATSGSKGEYHIDAVTPSTYSVTFSSNGFASKELAGLVVTSSVVTSANAQLDVGNVSTTVAVEAAPPSVQTESGELSHSISSQEIHDLPINTLNPIELVLTEPGAVSVASRDSFTNGVGFAENGLRPRGNNFLIDGFDNNDNGITGQALQPQNLEAVKEVSVQTNSYSPEFGRGGASVTNVIYKNGTNEFHGALWDRYTAAALYAIPVEQKNNGITVSPQFVENVYGFSVGGPAIKNKLFFFGSSQWDHLNGAESGNQITIPTAAGVSALQSIGTPTAALIVSSLGGLTSPTPTGTINVGNRTGCGSPCLVEIGTEIRDPKQLSRSYEYVVRGDYVASDKDTISARYIGSSNSLTPDLFANPNALPTQETSQGGPARNFGAFWTHVVDPTKVNELRFTAQTINFTFGPLASTLANPLYNDPNISIAGFTGTTFGGLSSTFPQGRGHNTFQYQDAFSIVAGSHSMKFGADLEHLAINDVIPFNSRGTVNFTAGGDCTAIGLTTACTALANFLDDTTGPSGSAGKQFGTPNISFPQTQQFYYFQDSWKLRSNLTLTYGVRWEYYGTPLNSLAYPAINANAAFTPEAVRVTQQPDYNNFGPRVGFAYSPDLFGDNKTVFRGGFGVFYDSLFSNIADNSASTAPNALGGTLTAPSSGRGLPGALELVPAVTASLNPFATEESVLANIRNPLIYQYNFDIERQLPGGFITTVAYVGTRGERLFVNQQLNPGVNGVRLDPVRGSVVARSNEADSNYNGLQIETERRYSHGFLLRGSYTFSKAIDDASDVFTNSGGSSFPQNLGDIRQDRAPSAFDRRHRGVVTWVYTVPSARNNANAGMAVLNAVIRDWQVSGTASFQSGVPDTIFIDSDINGDLSATNDRPNLGNIRAPINYSAACTNSPTCITGVGQYQPDGSLLDYNTGAPGTASQFRYIVQASGLGNLGRNTYFGPGRQDYTLAATRIIKIPHFEGKQFEFRAEAFNPFNHPNAGGGTTASTVSTNIADPNFMNTDITYEGGRQIRLWLKFRF